MELQRYEIIEKWNNDYVTFKDYSHAGFDGMYFWAPWEFQSGSSDDFMDTILESDCNCSVKVNCKQAELADHGISQHTPLI